MKSLKVFASVLATLISVSTIMPNVVFADEKTELPSSQEVETTSEDTQDKPSDTAVDKSNQVEKNETEAADMKETVADNSDDQAPEVDKDSKSEETKAGENVNSEDPKTESSNESVDDKDQEVTDKKNTKETETVTKEETTVTVKKDASNGVASDSTSIIASGTCGDNLTWELDSNGTLTISGSGEMYNYNVSPSPWDENSQNIKSVFISDGVKSIGDYAFQYCYLLASVTIPDSVTSIGSFAFYGCALSSVTIPDSVTSIGDSAFCECHSLASVTIPDSVTSIGSAAFYGCFSLASVTIPDSVTSIGDHAFYSCVLLTSVTIPDGVTNIGDHAFYECFSLDSVTIPDSVTSIGSFAFYECHSLASVTIPDSVTSIGSYAFSGCTSLTSVVLNKKAYSGEAFPSMSSDIFHYYYDVTYTSDGHGTVTGKARSYGTDKVALTITPDAGYAVDKVTFVYANKTVELTPDADGKITMPDATTAATINVTFKIADETPAFKGHSLLLSDNIGVRFRISFPDGFDTSNCYVSFKISDGRTGSMTYANAQQIEGSTDRYFMIGINAIELADTITATLHYGDGQTLTHSYSAMDYIRNIQAKYNTYPNGEKLLALVNSLQDYGYYMQQSGWGDNANHAAIPEPNKVLGNSDIEAAKSGVEKYTLVNEVGTSGIESKVKVGLTLNTQTELRVSVKPGEGVTITSTGYTERQIDGSTYYQFSVKNIGPKNLGKTYTVTVETNQGTATIQLAAMYYLKSIMNGNKLNEAQMKALTAYYNYYTAGYNY